MQTENCLPKYGPTNPSPEEQISMPVKRFASLIGLKAGKEKYYRELHASVWPAIIDRLRKSNIRNYSIYISEIEGKKYLISYLEYTGDDYEGDMQAIANDPDTQQWWKETDPCQFRLPSRKPDEKWSDLEMVFLME